jgi:ankyrin repeat protein
MAIQSSNHCCDHCKKSFASADKLKKHSRYHNKRYKCHFCKKCFALHLDLRRHEESVHRVGPGKYVCSVAKCLFTAARKDLLLRHKKISHPDAAKDKEQEVLNATRPSSSTQDAVAPFQPPDDISWLNAARDGNVAALHDFLITKRVALDFTAVDGNTALHCAAGSGNTAGIEILLQKGANMNAENGKGRTPLQEAIRGKHHEGVQKLLEGGASLDNIATTAKSLARSNSAEIFETCIGSLEAGPRKDELKRKTLFEALKSRGIEFLSALLSPENNRNSLPNGVDTDHRLVEGRDDLSWAAYHKGNKRGLTPMHYAAANRDPNIVKLLVSNGFNINIPFSHTKRPLYSAAERRNTAIVEYLLQLPDIQVNCAHGYMKTTPLHNAARAGHIDVAKLLLSHPATSLNAVDRYGKTSLYYAAIAGRREMVALLLSQKQISFAAPDYTLLQHAVFHDQWPIVKILLDYQSGPGGNNVLKVSPEQSQVSSFQIVDRLFRHPDFPDKNVRYGYMFDGLVHVAARKNHRGLVRHLLSYRDIDVNLRNRLRQTPLHYAVNDRRCDSVKELLKHPKIDVNPRDKYEKLPLQIAKGRGDSEIIELLVAHGAVDH